MTRHNPSSRLLTAVIGLAGFAVVLTGSAGEACACNVPVFRYAMERWPADPYDLVVFHRGSLSDEAADLIFELKEGDLVGPCRLQTLDAGAEPADDVRAGWLKLIGDHKLPAVMVRYPRTYPDEPPACILPFDRAAIELLLDSPMRREIARQLLAGESVVWLLVESGDADADRAAGRKLESDLAELAEQLELPRLDDFDWQNYIDPETHIELKLSFRLLTMSRSDPAERLFLTLLDNWNPDAAKLGKPMAFAFYGRGRVLGPLTGDQINTPNLTDACAYLIDACSCQVKAQNPGWDMLMRVDWDAVVTGELTLAEALPRLTTPAAAIESAIALEQAAGRLEAAPTAAAAPEPRGGIGIVGLVGLALLMIVVIVAAASIVLTVRRGGGGV
jgi:hypothetical protein